MKNKTLAAWLTFFGGALGLHRFYLHGPRDWLGWLLPIPTALGIYGLQRVQQHGLDDTLSWVLIPLLGFTFSACALTAIVYGLMSTEQWNARFNPQAPADAPAGLSNWFTIGAIAVSLLVGAGVLVSSMAYSLQRYFEHQIQQARELGQ